MYYGGSGYVNIYLMRTDRPSTRWMAFRIAFLYALLGGAWIFFSDRLVAIFASSIVAATLFSTVKGFFYVFVTAFLLYYLVRRNLELLRRESSRLQSILDASPEGIVLLGTDAHYTFANEAVSEIFGLAQNDIIGRYCPELMQTLTSSPLFCTSSEDKEGCVVPLCLRALSGKRVMGEEFRITRADGSYSDVIANFVPLYEGRIVVGTVGSFRDITKRRQAEEELQNSERRFREFLENVRLVGLMLDSQGRIVFANKYLLELTGWQASEVLGKDWVDMFIPPEHRSESRSILASVQVKGKFVSHHENEILTKTGQSHLISWVNTPNHDAKGNVVGVTSIGEDITERHRIEEAERELEALKQLDIAKTNFLNAVSHELRTPLNSITGFGSILEDEVAGALNPTQKEYLHKLMEGANRLLRLIDDLLDYARMEANQLRLDETNFDYSVLIKGVTERFLPQLTQKRLTLSLDIEKDLPLAHGDTYRVEQILGNLLSNAQKFTPDGGKILIRVRKEDGMLLTEVTDTGIGIRPEDIPKLFTRFYQVQAVAGRVKGTGLGLSIAKSLVEAQGGAIGVRSEWGRGSTFWFTLPAAS